MVSCGFRFREDVGEIYGVLFLPAYYLHCALYLAASILRLFLMCLSPSIGVFKTMQIILRSRTTSLDRA